MKVTEQTEVTLDGKRYLLEPGDDITINEGIIMAILKKLLPIQFLEKLSPFGKDVMGAMYRIDPKKTTRVAQKFRENPSLFSLFD